MGREFVDIFEDWAEDYDHTVSGHDPEYKAVFEDYDNILEKVAKSSMGTILEFGVGTGNLTKKLLSGGHRVIGIEPSEAMREIAEEKLLDAIVLDGDFINFPKPTIEVNTIVSTYAFHHLTDAEKEIAVKKFAELLPKGGRVVFADTMFTSTSAKQRKILEAEKNGFLNLAEDLKREYYPTLETVEEIFVENNFIVSFQQMNEFAWLIIANNNKE
ncbi:class I SAM-dependent DNA methyltransferase [Ornithinibacillus californiensis]|uniref:class I SAM-dependent DNA methyltransferase n=1 Tax=Ornithinibacillus californiensis TaxID=161536 RepID=UPI00064DCD6B|nr:class I SAM-dependent methyltransferase [Ornithinibacillus californiensis]